MTDLWDYLKDSDKPIVLYGTGDGAVKLMDRLSDIGLAVSGIFANDEFVRGQQFHGFPVHRFSEVENRFGSMTVLLAFGTSDPNVLEQITRIAGRHELFVPDMPLYGSEYFTADYYWKKKEEIEFIRSMLADEISRNVFDCLLSYKLSGSFAELMRCPASNAWDLISCPQSGLFVDLGAYNGDTVLKYYKIFPTYSSILAVEPDDYNFRKLRERTSFLPNVEYRNCAVASAWFRGGFTEGKGRGSSFGGEKEIIFDSVDNMVLNRRVSFLKMDIEGMEREGIAGAIRTIRRSKPALLISAYHRTEDLFSLPIQVLNISPDYKVYLRKDLSVPAWDVNYLFLPAER